MADSRRTPPGRAGRLRLRHSLDVAERGADLLEQKLRILRSEHQRLQRAEEDADRAWRNLLPEAEKWLLRGLLLGGEQALDAAAADIAPAEVTVHWATSMGVRHPASVTTSVPGRPPTAAAPTNTALVHAETAYGRALRAAAEYAAAHAAAELVGAEVISTRHRVRALRRHWIPHLREALDRADLATGAGRARGRRPTALGCRSVIAPAGTASACSPPGIRGVTHCHPSVCRCAGGPLLWPRVPEAAERGRGEA